MGRLRADVCDAVRNCAVGSESICTGAALEMTWIRRRGRQATVTRATVGESNKVINY